MAAVFHVGGEATDDLFLVDTGNAPESHVEVKEISALLALIERTEFRTQKFFNLVTQ